MFSLIGIGINIIVTGIIFLFKKFLPYIAKKFGLGAIKFGLQKTASVAVVAVTVAFYTAFLVFISETYTQFKDLIDLFNNPTSYGGMSATSTHYFSCFLHLLNVSGIASGFNAAFSFGMTVLLFFFTRAFYTATIKALKIVSDEMSKATKLI